MHLDGCRHGFDSHFFHINKIKNEHYETAGRITPLTEKKGKKTITQSKHGSRHSRKLKRYSEGFDKMFYFFLKGYRSGILTFCGSRVDVEFEEDGPNGKEGFRLFDDGYFGKSVIYSRQPRILEGVIRGKKSWGLWLDQWTDGIVDWCFTKEEILGIFEKNKIEIPESLLKDFNNTLERKKIKRNEKMWEEYKNTGVV